MTKFVYTQLAKKMFKIFNQGVEGNSCNAFNSILQHSDWTNQKFLDRKISIRELAKILLELSDKWDKEIDKVN